MKSNSDRSLLCTGLLLCAILSMSLKAHDTVQRDTGYVVRVVPNGYFSAQHGTIVLVGTKLELFSSLPRIMNKDGVRVHAPDNDELRDEWRGERWYNETYELQNGEWGELDRRFSVDAPQSSRLCDPLNQLSVRSRFPVSAPYFDNRPELILKQRIYFPDAFAGLIDKSDQQVRLWAVVFTEAKIQVKYPIKLALVTEMRGKREWDIEALLNVSTHGYFCGAEAFRITLTDGTIGWNVLVFVDEPAGSSNYLSAYSFLITIGRNDE